jgi:hypothetical protein
MRLEISESARTPHDKCVGGSLPRPRCLATSRLRSAPTNEPQKGVPRPPRTDRMNPRERERIATSAPETYPSKILHQPALRMEANKGETQCPNV